MPPLVSYIYSSPVPHTVRVLVSMENMENVATDGKGFVDEWVKISRCRKSKFNELSQVCSTRLIRYPAWIYITLFKSLPVYREHGWLSAALNIAQ